MRIKPIAVKFLRNSLYMYIQVQNLSWKVLSKLPRCYLTSCQHGLQRYLLRSIEDNRAKHNVIVKTHMYKEYAMPRVTSRKYDFPLNKLK